MCLICFNYTLNLSYEIKHESRYCHTFFHTCIQGLHGDDIHHAFLPYFNIFYISKKKVIGNYMVYFGEFFYNNTCR
jgi:hypothetical protein